MRHPLPWLAALFAAFLMTAPAVAQDEYDDPEDYESSEEGEVPDEGDVPDVGEDYGEGEEYGEGGEPGEEGYGPEGEGEEYEDLGEGPDGEFGVHIGPDSFGLYIDQGDYDRYGRRGGGFGLSIGGDGVGLGIFFEGEGGRYRRGHWYCPRSHCRGRGHWGRGYGRRRQPIGRHAHWDCHPVFKRGYRRGHEVLIRARMCYDRDGFAYIEPGSRRVVRTY